MNLREHLLKGGLYLLIRQWFGTVVSFIGVVLLTRMIGPADYGYYLSSLGIITTVSVFGRLGVNIYLIRREDEPDAHAYHQAFTFLALSGASIVLIGQLSLPLFSRWFKDPDFAMVLRALLPTVLVVLLTALPMAQLERNLRYRAVSFVELGGLLTQHVVALGAAILGAGVWSPVAGFWVSNIVLAATSYASSGYRPSLFWSRPLFREMVGYGLGYSASNWIQELRSLVNPLIVGRYAGPEAVAFVALSVRLVALISVVKTITQRLAVPAFAKVQTSPDRLRRAVEEAMLLQNAAIAPLLAVFVCLSPWSIPRLFGEEWVSMVDVLPFIALSQVLNALFNMHSSALYVLRKNTGVIFFNSTRLVIFAGCALILVPRFGIVGYGIADMIAIPSYVILHHQMNKHIPISYANVAPLILAIVPTFFFVFAPLPWSLALWLPTVVVFLLPRQRRLISQYLAYLPKRKRMSVSLKDVSSSQ